MKKIKLFEEFANSVNEKKFTIGDTWEWHGKDWDPKKKDNVDVVKKVKITKVEGSKITGQFDGESKEYIIRDADKYLKQQIKESVVNESETLIFDEIGVDLTKLQDQVDAMLKWDISDSKWINALKGIQSALNKVDDLVAKADQKLGAITYNESEEMNEGIVSIKGGRIIAHKVLNKLVDMGLIPVKKKSEDLLETIAEVIVNVKMESVETEGAELNEAVEVKVSLKHAKEAIGLFNDMYRDYGTMKNTDVFSFKNKDAAHDFVQGLVKHLHIPVGEIDAPENLLK